MSVAATARASPTLQSYYQYTPLFSERSIRLIKLLQETQTGVPQCKLLTINLDNSLPFVALSYTWGSPLVQPEGENKATDQCFQILCNGQLLNVTQNLYDFLKRARSSGSENWFGLEDHIWIDAICINQSKLDERSAQVRLMSEIYKAAKTVVVWLGESEHNEAQYAVELLERISAAPMEDLNSLKKLQIGDPRMLEVLGECGASTVHWRSLKGIFSRTWFRRIWIIQEVAFAENIIVICGNQILIWEDCIRACEFISYSVGNDLQTPSTVPYAGSNAEILSMFQESDSTDLLDVLITTRSFAATDPRDKIFAVLGLATLGRTEVPATEIIYVDYTLTPAQVYLETAWTVIKKSKDLNLLAEVEDPQLRNIADIPTWVPDFSSTYRPSIYHQSLAFNAYQGLKRSLTSLSNSRLLGTAAYRVGEIISSESLGVNEPFIEYFPRILAILFELSLIYVNNQDRLEVLWRTMIQDGLEWVNPAAADTAGDFKNWILVNIAEAVIEGRNDDSVRERVDRLIGHLEAYSKTDSSGIMPTQQHIKEAIWQLETAHSDGIPEQIGSATRYGHELTYYHHMRLFSTDNGLLGLGQPSIQTGDSLWIIPGVSVPMVLQGAEIENRFNVVGPAYIHGIMNGEALESRWSERKLIILE
jgi:hypothetical protein